MSYKLVTDEEIKNKIEENVFVRSTNSYYANEDPFIDCEYELNVARYDSLEELRQAFMTYDALRQCFVYKNLVFVNSTLGGGWEAWTLKKFGDELVAFESISIQRIIKDGEFEELIKQLLKATKEQCLTLTY